jgi:hypothetical protein
VGNLGGGAKGRGPRNSSDPDFFIRELQEALLETCWVSR